MSSDSRIMVSESRATEPESQQLPAERRKYAPDAPAFRWTRHDGQSARVRSGKFSNKVPCFVLVAVWERSQTHIGRRNGHGFPSSAELEQAKTFGKESVGGKEQFGYTRNGLGGMRSPVRTST